MKIWTFVVGSKSNRPIICNVPYDSRDKLETSITDIPAVVTITSDTGELKACFYVQDLIGYYVREIEDVVIEIEGDD